MTSLPKVVYGEPSLPADFHNATVDYECDLFPKGYTVYIEVDDKVIGYATFHNFKNTSITPKGYWCGYCYVPDIFYNTARKFEKNLGRKLGENVGDWFDILLNQIPEITFIAPNATIIGWDHAHPRDEDNYTNLAGVLAEIWSVWKLCGSY